MGSGAALRGASLLYGLGQRCLAAVARTGTRRQFLADGFRRSVRRPEIRRGLWTGRAGDGPRPLRRSRDARSTDGAGSPFARRCTGRGAAGRGAREGPPGLHRFGDAQGCRGTDRAWAADLGGAGQANGRNPRDRPLRGGDRNQSIEAADPVARSVPGSTPEHPPGLRAGVGPHPSGHDRHLQRRAADLTASPSSSVPCGRSPPRRRPSPKTRR